MKSYRILCDLITPPPKNAAKHCSKQDIEAEYQILNHSHDELSSLREENVLLIVSIKIIVGPQKAYRKYINLR